MLECRAVCVCWCVSMCVCGSLPNAAALHTDTEPGPVPVHKVTEERIDVDEVDRGGRAGGCLRESASVASLLSTLG